MEELRGVLSQAEFVRCLSLDGLGWLDAFVAVQMLWMLAELVVFAKLVGFWSQPFELVLGFDSSRLFCWSIVCSCFRSFFVGLCVISLRK